MASSDARPKDIDVQPEPSEPIRLMAAAFDRVLELLPATVDRTDAMRREVALFIVDRFRLGERDPDRLSDLALAELGPGGAESVALVPDGDATSEPLAG
jgi:hypothetical protein